MSAICEVWTADVTRDTHLVIVGVRVLVSLVVTRLRPYRRPQEHLPPPAEAAGAEDHVGQAEPEAEPHRQREHRVARQHRTWRQIVI